MTLVCRACQGRDNAAEKLGQEWFRGRAANSKQKGKEGILPMAGQIFMRADEVASVLGVSKPYAYKPIKKLNEKLEKTGCLTFGQILIPPSGSR